MIPTISAMDKLTGITYNDGTPNASYQYKANGQLTQSSNANVTNNYTSFDGDGRVTGSSVTMGGVTYPFTYTYDQAGDLTQESYPSGRQVNYTYDVAQRPLTVNGVSAGTTTNYVQSVGYYPHGAPQFWQYGNGLWCWQNVNKMLTSWEAWATQNNNGNNWMFVAYNGFDNSENVISQTEGYGPGVPWNSMTFLNDQFQYDNLSRLSSVTDTSYSRGYHYDEFGNMSVQSYSVIAPPGFAPQNNGGNPYNAATNHLVAVDAAGGYEARGMVTKLGPGGTVQMAYDAEGNMKNSSDSGMGGQSVTWIYDAEGQRAQKVVAGGSSTLYVHDAFGQLAATYSNNGVTPACTTCYLTYDMLGSPRLITDQTDSVIARHDFIPFGEEIPNTVAGRNGNFGSSSNVTQGFTGQESDGGSAGLDFYNARHFSAVMGSFMQPDPGNAGADFLRPQSWNGYGYVLGNPLGLVDPSGMAAVCDKVCGVQRSDAGVVGYSGIGGFGGDDGYSGVTDGDCFSAANSTPCGGVPGTGGYGGGTIPIYLGGSDGSGPIAPSVSGSGIPIYNSPLLPVGAAGGAVIYDSGVVFVDVVIDALGGIACVGSGACEVIAAGAAATAVGAGAYMIYQKVTRSNTKKPKYSYPPRPAENYDGPGAGGDDCSRQWVSAYQKCLMTPKKGMSADQCAAGYVSQSCGGHRTRW